MKHRIAKTLTTELLILLLVVVADLKPQARSVSMPRKRVELQVEAYTSELKEAAFAILSNKCNVCHRKKNPFKVFSLKNMEKNASRIYQQVFVLGRMPKGNQIQLTAEEYQILENWLNTQTLNTSN